MGLVELSLPCRLVELSLRLGPEHGRTTLEEIAMKAIAAGRTSIEAQTDLLKLPHRVMLDILGGLWGAGYLVVDPESGGLALTDGARALLATGEAGVAASQIKQRPFLFEPITGRFFDGNMGNRRP